MPPAMYMKSANESVIFDKAFTGRVKLITVYDLGGRLVAAKTFGTSSVNLRRDLGIPAGVQSLKIDAVKFSLPQSDRTQPLTLRLFDIRGRLVTTLVREATRGGSYSVQWNGAGRSGTKTANGWYLLSLSCGSMKKSMPICITN